MSPPKPLGKTFKERRMTDGDGLRVRFSGVDQASEDRSPFPVAEKSEGLRDVDISEKSSPDKLKEKSPLPF